VTGRDLPLLNACLNALTFILLCLGMLLIQRGMRRAHGWCMGLASLVSAGFLTSYLIYHFAVVPEIGHTPFHGRGIVRYVYYYGLLLSHVVLAIVQLPMILLTLWRAARRDWKAHRRIARATWPVWAYVSVSGVLVYLCLYPWNPAPS
jgi:uncharacterized membrane protein YozB (DUF420 family)